MTESEATQQSPGPDPDSSADEVTVNVSSAGEEGEAAGSDSDSSADEAKANIAEAGEEGVAADYETRLAEFDDVDSVPVVSVPVQSSELAESDLKVQSPGDQSG